MGMRDMQHHLSCATGLRTLGSRHLAMELLHDALQALTVLRGQAGVQEHVRRAQVPRARELWPQRGKDLQVLRRVTWQLGRHVASH